MGMMARMRSLAPWFILLVGGLFVIFMIISDSNVLDFLGQKRTQNVGSVDGEDITYQEYNSLVERARKNQEQQTGQTIDESQMDYFRDQVWEALVTQKLIDKKIKEYGIEISDEEVNNAIMGPNPPAFLRQQFVDSTGNFNRQLYERTILDPKNKDIMVAVEEQIRQQLIQEKLQNYITASITVSDGEAKDKFIMQNIKMKSDYVMIDPYGISGDFKASDEEAKAYYEKHIDDYQIDESRKMKYVLFRKQATSEDSLSILNNLAAVIKKAKNDTAAFKNYVDIYSERPYSKDTLGVNQIPAEAQSVVANAQVGSIVGPVASREGYVVYKVIGKSNAKNEFVRASHILIKSTGNDAADEKRINDIYNEVKGGTDFAKVARQKSEDGSSANGGDLGWFGKGQMVKEFENACYSGGIGVIQKPVKTQFGWHIIKVTGKSSDNYVVERIVNKIQPSATSIDKLYQDAQDFNYVANDNDFESEAKLLKYSVIETPPFSKDAQAIPGIGVSSSLVKWAFENSKGDISDVYRVSAGYVVAMVSEEIKAGAKPFDEVKEAVRNGAVREKRFTKAMSIAKDIRSKLGDAGNKDLAKTVYANAKVDTTADYTTSGIVSSIGREFAFTEYSYKADLNKWSQPVKGNSGVYLIYVKSRTQFDKSAFEMQKSAIRNDLLQQKKTRYMNQWVQQIKKEADVVDNRNVFFK
jgi:peptidyl-prolyl cis-trans isomerase D